MKVLFIGDIFGSLGRAFLAQELPKLKDKYEPDLIFANGENIAHGKGVNEAYYQFLVELGIDGITLGNHAFDNRSVLEFIDEVDNLIRPANFPDNNPGKGITYVCSNDQEVALISLQGRTFMSPSNCPFTTVDRLIDEAKRRTELIFVDFHAEASSEKVAMGLYLDGRVSAVVGTHTHVPTADERILPKKTAYITDIGMTGPLDGVIGMQAEPIIQKFKTGLPVRFNPMENGSAQLNAVLIEVDAQSKEASQITRINLRQES